MKKCADDCAIACDFCKHYASASMRATDVHGDTHVLRWDNGQCALHNRPVEGYEHCDDFHCRHAKEGDRT